MIEWLPADRVDVVNVAWPPLPSRVVPRGLPLSKKVTLPVGVPPAGAVTVAVKVTGWPATEGLVDDEMVVPVVAGVVHVARVIVSVSRVTEPLRASARPSRVTPVVIVMDARARMVPRKVELVPSVAELPTCQKTLQADPPLMMSTRLADAVISVEAALKTKTAFGSPSASRVSLPVIWNVPVAEL